MKPIDTPEVVTIYSPEKSGLESIRSKIINDPVHGHFRIRGECIKVIDTPEFQRLRDVKQLGSSYYVFPGAGHNRFEHSLGVCHLAEEMVLRLKRGQPEIATTQNDVKLVALAGLCHDLGHAPFSHVFEAEFLPKILGDDYVNWNCSHEEMSSLLLEQIIDKKYIDEDVISKEDCRKVGDLIRSSCHGYKTQYFKDWDQKQFLREIVANGRNSIDVDKFDYLARDCFYCGVKASCDFSRVMPFVRVIDDTICFKASEVGNVYEIFQTRASLHRRVYTHKVAKAIEYMIVDAMVEANDEFKIVEKARDPKTFIELDDSILKRIEFAPESDSPRLEKAKELVHRIRTRKNYRYVNEFVVEASLLKEWKKVKPEDVVNFQDKAKTGVELRPDDIVIHNMKIDWSMKDKNPVDSVFFFQDARSTEKFHIDSEQVSTLLPSVFQEKRVRLFVKNEKHWDAAALAFENYQRKQFGKSKQICETPPRNKKQVFKSFRQLNNPAVRKKMKLDTVHES